MHKFSQKLWFKKLSNYVAINHCVDYVKVHHSWACFPFPCTCIILFWGFGILVSVLLPYDWMFLNTQQELLMCKCGLSCVNMEFWCQKTIDCRTSRFLQLSLKKWAASQPLKNNSDILLILCLCFLPTILYVREAGMFGQRDHFRLKRKFWLLKLTVCLHKIFCFKRSRKIIFSSNNSLTLIFWTRKLSIPDPLQI